MQLFSTLSLNEFLIIAVFLALEVAALRQVFLTKPFQTGWLILIILLPGLGPLVYLSIYWATKFRVQKPGI